MTILLVPEHYATIEAALLDAVSGDTIDLAAGYGPETVDIKVSGVTIHGSSSVQGIELFIDTGVTGLVLTGDAPINVTDTESGDIINGNDGANTITVTGGVDTVNGGLGIDRLVVDYSSSIAAITGTGASIDSGVGTVTILGFEHYTVLTGSGAETLTFAHGDNYLNTGDGVSTIVVGDGTNTFIGGSGADTVTVGTGSNYINTGEGVSTIVASQIGAGDNTIIGGGGADTVTVGTGSNYIYVGDGDNTVTASGTGFGDNIVVGGTGSDTITVGHGNNHITAGDGAGLDTIVAGNGNNCIDSGDATNQVTVGGGDNYIIGGNSTDTIVAGNGRNFVVAGEGINTVTAGSGDNYITGGTGADTITANGGNNNIDAGGAANTVTTGAGNDVVKTGDGADDVYTGGGDDILKDNGGAGSLAAGSGHDRLILDFTASKTDVTNTITIGPTYGGVMGDTTYSGVEEFHITGGSGNDDITTGNGADVLDGGPGADTLNAGGGSDVIYGTVGDVITGGEDSDSEDHDVLVLKNLSKDDGVFSNAGNTENGTFTLISGGLISFTGIESIVFGDNTVTTPEDTILSEDLDGYPSSTVIVTTFDVGNFTYNAGETVYRTEGALTINSDGSYVFDPALNYNGPAPVINYTDSNFDTKPLFIEVTPVVEDIPDCFLIVAPTVIISEDGDNNEKITELELVGQVNVQILLPEGVSKGDTLTIVNFTDETTTSTVNVALTFEHIKAGEFLVEFAAPAVGQTITVTAEVDGDQGTSEAGVDFAEMVVCFVLGTLISTVDGEIPVEQLRVGDLVQTRDRGLQLLRWTGRRDVDASELSKNENMRPIRIRKDVISAESGVGDLVVSPQHRVLITSKVAQRMFGETEVLISAKQLLTMDGVDIAVDLEDVTYFHLLFDQHEIVYANGIPSESLYLGKEAQKSLSVDGREEIYALFPETASPDFVALSCRPIIQGKRARKLAMRHASNSKPLLDAKSYLAT
jgi:Ca2+-binding RTX toxin-like protein